MRRTIMGLVGLVVLAFAQSAIEGSWEGAIQLPSMEIGMEVAFVSEAEELTATIDIPPQGAFGLPLKNVSFEDPKVYFELPTSLAKAIFDGKLEEGKIRGSFTQGSAIGEFYLNRSEEVVLPPEYSEEEVSIKVTDDVKLAGTLSIPEGEGPFPVAVLISGSGAQDRDENVFGFKIFATIADHLTRQGIAVLRCDDRGVASSTGDREVATSEDYAEDVMAQVAYLATRSEIDTTHIGLLGHSEGALISGMVAADNPDIEFVILVAGTALPGDTVLKAQLVRVLQAEGSSEKMIAEQRKLQAKLLDYARTGKNEKRLRADLQKITRKYIKKEMSREERKALGDLDAFVEKRVEGKLKVVRSPWYRFFLDYDPRDDLAKVDARVLAFFGEKDVQAVAEVNAPAMDEFFTKIGKENYIIRICCKANHLFQSAETGAFSEYSTLPKEFTPCFLPNVTNFILGFLQVPCPDCKDGGCEKARTGNCPHHK